MSFRKKKIMYTALLLCGSLFMGACAKGTAFIAESSESGTVDISSSSETETEDMDKDAGNETTSYGDKTEIKQISASLKNKVYQYRNITKSDITVYGVLQDGSETEINDFSIDGTLPKNLNGSADITVKTGNNETSLTVEPVRLKEIQAEMSKPVYTGSSFDADNVSVTAVYEDGQSFPVKDATFDYEGVISGEMDIQGASETYGDFTLHVSPASASEDNAMVEVTDEELAAAESQEAEAVSKIEPDTSFSAGKLVVNSVKMTLPDGTEQTLSGDALNITTDLSKPLPSGNNLISFKYNDNEYSFPVYVTPDDNKVPDTDVSNVGPYTPHSYVSTDGTYLGMEVLDIKNASDLTVDLFLERCKGVTDFAREHGYRYGSSNSSPCCTDGLISCDRLVSAALASVGMTDQPQGGLGVGALDGWLNAHGFIRSTDFADMKRGSIMIVWHHDDTGGPGHAYVCASDPDASHNADRYDCGSNGYIQSVQPIRHPGYWYRTDRVIIYNIP